MNLTGDHIRIRAEVVRPCQNNVEAVEGLTRMVILRRYHQSSVLSCPLTYDLRFVMRS